MAISRWERRIPCALGSLGIMSMAFKCSVFRPAGPVPSWSRRKQFDPEIISNIMPFSIIFSKRDNYNLLPLLSIPIHLWLIGHFFDYTVWQSSFPACEWSEGAEKHKTFTEYVRFTKPWLPLIMISFRRPKMKLLQSTSGKNRFSAVHKLKLTSLLDQIT